MCYNSGINPADYLRYCGATDNGIIKLEKLPERHKLVNDSRLARQGIRPLHIENHTVFYTVDDGEKMVNIIRILYAHRDWQSLL